MINNADFFDISIQLKIYILYIKNIHNGFNYTVIKVSMAKLNAALACAVMIKIRFKASFITIMCEGFTLGQNFLYTRVINDTL